MSSTLAERFSTVAAAFVDLAVAARRAGEILRRLIPDVRTEREKLRYHLGGSGDLRGEWQSGVCAGWLHEFCPTGEVGAIIDCRCTCHGGTLR